MRTFFSILVLACLLMATACAVATQPERSADEVVTDPATAALDDLAGLGAPQDIGFVAVSAAAGNTSPGRADLTGTPIRVRIGEDPRWVVGQPVVGGIRFDIFLGTDGYEGVLLTPEGEVQVQREAFNRIEVREVPPLVEDVPTSPGGTMIDALVEDVADHAELAVVDDVLRGGDGSSNEVPVIAAVTPDGDLRTEVADGGAATIVDGPFLPDARPVIVADGLAAVLADPTEAYGHGVIGDAVEAGAVAIVDVRAGEVLRRLEPDPGRVIEQRRVHATMFEGEPAVVVTTSSTADGARVELWTVDGERRLVGPAIGQGNRWRHVVGVSSLPDGGIEIAEVITPHLGRIASLFRPDGDRLVQVAAAPDAIASHALGSRNLDQTALVDVDGDGRRDLVGPAADGDGIAWVVAGEDTANQSDAGQVMATNLAMVPRPDGTVVVAYATADGTLVIHA